MNKKRLLIIFVKNPELGKCKTRLAATIGDEKALVFYKNMLQKTKEEVEELAFDKAVYYSSFIDKDDLWPNNPPFYKHIQNSNPDLGVKMQSAFEDAFNNGYESVCIMGSDCYSLNKETLESAFLALEHKDVVLGPSNDGGYYLLGMNKPYVDFFQNKTWSTDTVAPDTVLDFKNLNLSYQLLDELVDIDNEEDFNTIPKEERNKLLIRY
ncbi:TIGR04282 family arsenosugar biosynthesis glycosyltransferase [Marivirga arenosa]|uniref:TIGR04282 family arsenosugar biosynthesis glycosyltransferase n=1 Tax=Marivirga arenosa TaxID=3059076 RepID=A0AA49GIB8_9BACT|nr:TIGR04282 family arsenosugar biosynthesis glycosyltransferase [Marivirga sp. BKB1-2]WKK79661.1 TIGR04282 family arsenosugar biosynthesis glycosyltransferase [Marivirga sp. BKB1-2]